MRIHPILLFVAVLASVTTAKSPCIDGCKCTSNKTSVKITECEKPFILTATAVTHFPENIITIGFRNVEVSSIESSGFKKFDKLQIIVFENCTIGAIDKDAFQLVDLSTVSFSKTHFKESPVLSSQYLEELIFQDCNLVEIPDLDDLPALSFLNLAKNRITEINPLAFRNLQNLEELHLPGNLIRKLPTDAFSKCEDFTTLNLDNNPLSPEDLYFPTTLEYLSMQNCNLTDFDSRLTKNLTLVTSLHLNGNKLSKLPIDAFSLIKDLDDLDLSNNELVEVDADIFSENDQLDKILLDNNRFDSLPKFTTTNNFQTTTFSCSNCGLTSIKGTFENMPLLNIVNLSHNNLKNVDGVFSEVRGPAEVILSFNKISKIHINTFGVNSQVMTLDLSNNPLAPLDPVVLSSLPSLTSLNISNCGLQSIWSNQNSEIPSVKLLDISKNILTDIKKTDLMILPNLKTLDLRFNPLICSDNLTNTINYLENKSIQSRDKVGDSHEEMIANSTYNSSRFNSNWEGLLMWDCRDDYDDEDYSSEDYDGNDLANNLPRGPGYEYDVDEMKPSHAPDEYQMDDEEADEASATLVETGGFSLAKASYILSITSVFILTALLVLFIAVVMTLVILKRNRNFNMHNGNLPRLKIPLWHTTHGLKKHSGSIYRPLSEEIYGSQISNHYDFKQTPQVHNS